MKLLLLAPHPFFQHRGTPIAVKLLLEVLSNHGYEIEMLTYHEGEDIYIPNTRIHRIFAIPGVRNIPPGPSWKKAVCDAVMFWKCLKLLKESHFDLIHAVEESVFIAMVMKELFRIPFVYDMDSSISQQIADKYRMLRPFRDLLQYSEKMAVRASAGVLAVCKSLETAALQFDPQKLVTRLEDISLVDLKVQEGERLQKVLGTNGPFVMYVGNLENYQGIDLLLESFQEAILQVPHAHLVIVGGNDEGIQRYKQRAKKLKIKEMTHFLGQRPISELASYLDQADVLVSPRSQGQNTPMKIFSYLDSGKPLLATRLPTHTQVLDDQIALLVPADTRAMAQGLITLLTNSAFGDKLALRAKERVRKEFSRDAFEKKLLSFYNTLEMSLAAGA